MNPPKGNSLNRFKGFGSETVKIENEERQLEEPAGF
jgi:hypothetical protein